MTSAEKLQRCIDLAPVRDRREIPVLAQIITYAGVCAGYTQKEIAQNNKKFQQALKKTYDIVGYPDSNYNLCVGDVYFSEGLPVRRPGIELDDNALFQFVEGINMQPEDYKLIAEKGWTPWYNAYMRRIQNPPFKNDLQLTLRFIKLGMHGGSNLKFQRKLGVEPITGTATMPAFDMLSMIRSFGEFVMDIYEDGDAIKAAIDRATPEIIESTLTNAKRAGVSRIGYFAMRSDANSISPSIFDEFSFPSIKATVEAFHKAGYTTVLHADGNWLPMLDRFTQLPKGSVHFEFDGVTDIFKAYDIIGGWQSMRGDVGATMLSFETPDAVSEYCEKLVTELGMKGGFMLGSGCEVPMTAKAENVRAMINSVR